MDKISKRLNYRIDKTQNRKIPPNTFLDTFPKNLISERTKFRLNTVKNVPNPGYKKFQIDAFLKIHLHLCN